jgi:hypothetical protein
MKLITTQPYRSAAVLTGARRLIKLLSTLEQRPCLGTMGDDQAGSACAIGDFAEPLKHLDAPLGIKVRGWP